MARMMLALVLISLLADAVLVALSTLPLADMGPVVAYGVAAPAFYGASSAMSWGLSRPIWHAGAYLAGYVLAVLALNGAFRHLYGMFAGAA